MKITIIIRNEDSTHEEVDNIAGEIEDLLESEGYVKIKVEEFATEYHVTCELAEEDEEEAEGEEA